jgi:VIT1/CCC1 family predicted Fe2+/Mn2+ transporter
MYLTTQDKKQTTITIKVPATQYESCFAQIKALGKVKSESSSGQDVTRQYIDLSARLKNLQAEEKQLSDIMGMSRNVTEILSVEKELFRVRGDIESTQAQLNYLGSQVDFSTITVSVAEPQPTVEYDWGLDTAFKEAVRAFIGMVGALIIVTGYLIPLILYFVIGLAVLYLVVRAVLELYKWWKGRKAKAGKP